MNRYERHELWRKTRLTSDRTETLEALRPLARSEQSIGIYSSTTWRPIVPFLEGELLAEGCQPRIVVHEYEAMEADIASGSETFDAIVLAIDDPPSYGPVFDQTSKPSANSSRRILDALLARVVRLRERTSTLLLMLPPEAPRAVAGLPTLEPRRQDFIAALREELSTTAGVELIEDSRLEVDPRLWYLGRIPYTDVGFARLARTLSGHIALTRGRGIKAVVLDLDNTLWGGVLGECGLAGIELGEGYPGRCYQDFQRQIAGWVRSGVLVALASKNDLSLVEEVFRSHPEMVLRAEDISHREVHWRPKSESLATILKTFNIGPEATFFVDDNPRERADVAARFPEIAVFDFPEDPEYLCSQLADIPWGIYAATSNEDTRRRELQAQQSQRQQASGSASNREDYLQSLEICVEIAFDEPADVARVTQLHQKTNQFNMNPIRHTDAEILEFAQREDRHFLSLRYRDRFGDAGLVGAATVTFTDETVLIPTFLLSCRIIGLGVEEALLAAICQRWPVPEIGLSFTATDRNTPAAEFVARLETREVEGQSGRYWIESRAEVPSWIQSTVKESEHAL